MSKFTSCTPHVSPIDSAETTSPSSFKNVSIAPDNLQRHALGSLDSPHQRFVIMTDFNENVLPKSTSHEALASSVCEKVVMSPSTANEAKFVSKVEDWLAVLFSATFTLSEE